MVLTFPPQVPGKSSDPLGEVPARNKADGAIRLSYTSDVLSKCKHLITPRLAGSNNDHTQL